MSEFNPQMQILYCRDVERVFFGKAPRINLLVKAYGRNMAESWLEIQLNDLSNFSGCKEKLSLRQIKEIAAIIVDKYPTYNLAEFMLFFQRFKSCRYGRFYGAVDPMIIMQSLAEFNEERRQAYIERENAEKEKQRQEEEWRWHALTRRYAKRVPDAFTPKAPISALQYRLMGYDSLSDDELKCEIEAICAGNKTIPADALEMIALRSESSQSMRYSRQG